MDKLVSLIKKPARLITMLSLGGYALFYSLYLIGMMAALGDVGIIFGGLFSLIIVLGLVCCYIFAIIKHKTVAAKTIGVALLAYYIVNALFTFRGIYFSGNGANVAHNVFLFIALLALLVSVFIFVAGLFLDKFRSGKILRIVSFCGIAAFVLFALIANFIDFANAGAWYAVMYILADILVLPAVLLGFLIICVPSDPAPEIDSESNPIEPEPTPEENEPEAEPEIESEPEPSDKE